MRKIFGLALAVCIIFTVSCEKKGGDMSVSKPAKPEATTAKPEATPAKPEATSIGDPGQPRPASELLHPRR